LLESTAVAFISRPIQAQVGLKYSLLGMRINTGTPRQCRAMGLLFLLESTAVAFIYRLTLAQVGLKYSLLGM